MKELGKLFWIVIWFIIAISVMYVMFFIMKIVFYLAFFAIGGIISYFVIKYLRDNG